MLAGLAKGAQTVSAQRGDSKAMTRSHADLRAVLHELTPWVRSALLLNARAASLKALERALKDATAPVFEAVGTMCDSRICAQHAAAA